MTAATAGGTESLCACGCGQPAARRRTWADACYFRWYRAGKPDTGPPPPKHGPARSAILREDFTWLVDAGTSANEAAARVGIGARTARRYLAADAAPQPCAHQDCEADATRGRWCPAHRDTRTLYTAARAAGLGRQAAARRIGVHLSTTYRWEPGEPGQGRPREKTAVRAAEPSSGDETLRTAKPMRSDRDG